MTSAVGKIGSRIANDKEVFMLNQVNPIPTIGVKNIQVAKEFYESKLGLLPEGETDGMVQMYKSGKGQVEIYQSDFAGTNQSTSVTWTVGGELEKEVASLKSKGIEFEHYQIPESKLEGDIHVLNGMKAAWFKDPDGNILCLHG